MILARSLSGGTFPSHRCNVFTARIRLAQGILPAAVRCGAAIARSTCLARCGLGLT
jgi:hypothetical protein